jgi:hypothetical protein
MVLKLILINDDVPAVRAERYKMLANACQVIALGILGAAIIAPAFNPGLKPSIFTRLGGGVIAALVELLAMRIIGYISTKTTTKED